MQRRGGKYKGFSYSFLTQRRSGEPYLAINPPDKHAPSKSLDGDGRLADPLESSADAQHSVLLLQGDGSSRPPQVLRKPAKHGEKVSNQKSTPYIVTTSIKPYGEENLLSQSSLVVFRRDHPSSKAKKREAESMSSLG